MIATKADFMQWRGQDITQEFQTDMLAVVDECLGYLAVQAGKDPVQDRKIVGIIEGVQWLINWQPTIIDEDEDDANSEGSQASH